jgi:nickel-dependent lactate racemase
LHLRLPKANLVAVASPVTFDTLPDPTREVRRALQQTIGMDRFRTLVHRGAHVVILVDDSTRPTPAYHILPPLLEELRADELDLHVQILLALATHRPMTAVEVAAKIGTEIADCYEWLQHDSTDRSQMLDLGRTSNGTPIEVSRLVLEADVSIGVGNICAHPLAGWGGGGKIIQPGVCSNRTTDVTHFLSGQVPGSCLGRISGNVVRLEMEEVARRARLTGIVNTVLDGNGAIVRVVAGDLVAAHRAGVEVARSVWQVGVPALADIVVVSSYPSDTDYWQACKGVFCAENVVKRGGEIILVTPCPERISTNPSHLETLTALAGVASKEMPVFARDHGLTDYNAVGCAMLMRRANETAFVTVVSEGMTPDDCAILGHDYAITVDEAMARALARQGSDATITVLTHGGESYAVVMAKEPVARDAVPAVS